MRLSINPNNVYNRHQATGKLTFGTDKHRNPPSEVPYEDQMSAAELRELANNQIQATRNSRDDDKASAIDNYTRLQDKADQKRGR